MKPVRRSVGLLVMLEDYPGDLSIIIDQVREVENLLSSMKVNFGPALAFISATNEADKN